MRASTASSSPPSWPRAWLSCAAAGGIFCVASHGLGVLRHAPVWRVRDFGWTPILRRLAERADLDLFAVLPQAVSWHVSTPSGRATWLLVAALANALFSALAAGLLSPALRLVLRRRTAATQIRVAAAAGLGLFALPAIELPLARALHDVPSGPTLLWSSTASLLLAAGLWAILDARRARAVGRLAARSVGWFAIVTLAAIAISVSAARRDTDLRPLPSPDAPNVLLVSIDSLRPDHLGCYGYARNTSPTLDALAREGARFATVVSSSSWTLPAHVTLFTGLPAERHGVIRDERRVAEEAVTLAEVLHAAGWRTGGVASGPYLEAGFGFAQGFESFDDWSANRVSERFSHRGSTSPHAIAAAERFLDGDADHAATRPFFLFLHLWDVHYDYEPPPPWDTAFDPDYRGPVDGRDFEQGTAIHREMDPRDLAHVVALYDGEIRHTDEALGRLLARLRERGLLDRTLVAVVADHGDEFFEHGDKGHRNNLYDTTILVPWLLRWPARVPAGRVVPGQVRLEDVGPTLLGLLGVQPAAAFARDTENGTAQGRDVGAWIASDDSRVLAPVPATSDLHGTLATLRNESEKLIHGPTRDELYDLARDPGERDDLAAADPARVAALRQVLTEQRGGAQAGLARPVELDDAQRERLRALGYLE